MFPINLFEDAGFFYVSNDKYRWLHPVQLDGTQIFCSRCFKCSSSIKIREEQIFEKNPCLRSKKSEMCSHC